MPFSAVTENQPYLRNGKAYRNFKLGIRMEYDDLHHRHARLAVQFTTCRGRGHIVAAALQAQLVIVVVIVVYLANSPSSIFPSRLVSTCWRTDPRSSVSSSGLGCVCKPHDRQDLSHQ